MKSDKYIFLPLPSFVMLFLSCIFVFNTSLANDAEPVDIQFRVHAQSRIQNLGYFLNGTFIPLNFYSSSASEKFEYKGAPTIHFYDVNALKTVENPNDLQSSAQFQVDGKSADYLLLFFPHPNPSNTSDSPKYFVIGFPDCLKSRPAQTITMLNASGSEVFADVGGERIVAEPKMNRPIRVTDNARVRLALRTESRAAMFYNQPLEVNPSERIFFIIFPSFTPGSIALQTRILRETLAD
jgi:hypothetical protein